MRFAHYCDWRDLPSRLRLLRRAGAFFSFSGSFVAPCSTARWRWLPIKQKANMRSPKPIPATDQPIQVLLPVPIIPVHRLALVAPGEDVNNRTLRLQPQRASHNSIIHEAHG